MTRIEVISGVERQRRWSDEEKMTILREAFSRGASVAVVGRRYDVRVQQIYRWRKKLLVEEPTAVFLPVSIVGNEMPDRAYTAPTTDVAVSIEISLRKGRGLKIPANIERGTLASLIACVEGA